METLNRAKLVTLGLGKKFKSTANTKEVSGGVRVKIDSTSILKAEKRVSTQNTQKKASRSSATKVSTKKTNSMAKE